MKSLRFSLRYLSKSRGSNFTRVISLTLGLAVSLLLFSYVGFMLSFDRCYPDKDRIYQMWVLYGVQGVGLSEHLNAPVAPCMEQDMPQVEAATRTTWPGNGQLIVGESSFECFDMLADTSFFEVFGIKQLSGESPQEIFATRDKMMISRSLAKAAFGDENPVGKKVSITNKHDFTVAGVFEELPVNTSLGDFNVLIPFSNATGNTGWHNGDSYRTYLKLKKGTSIGDVEAQIPSFMEKYGMTESMKAWQMEYLFTPIIKTSFMKGNNLSMVRLLSALAFLLLFVATMNYVLVSISGMVRRSRTIALLKCNGAHKSDIFRIFLSETLVLILCALVLAVLILVAFAKPIEQLTSYHMTELFALQRIWTPVLVMLAAFLLAGLIPAGLFTKVPVESAFKGMSDNKRTWKQVLLGLEIACITCVVTLLWVTSLQFKQLRDGDFGYEPDNLISVSLKGRPAQFPQYAKELESIPEVESVGYAYHKPIYGYSGMPCVDEISHKLLFSCRWEVIDPNYIPAMRMEIVEGENLKEDSRRTDVIVNQEYVRARGWSDSPIGRQIVDMEDADAEKYTIVGVVKDFKMESDGQVLPIVMHNLTMLFGDPEQSYWGFNTMIRLRDMSPETLGAVNEKLKEYESSNDHRVEVYIEELESQLRPIRSLRNIIGVGSLVTLLVALIGLLGYLTDECNRRSREVAVRKVNGATVKDILLMLSWNTLTMVVISIALGLAASYFAAGRILVQYSTRIPLSWWIFAGSGLAVLAVVYVIQTIKTWRIANSNPSLMLKSE